MSADTQDVALSQDGGSSPCAGYLPSLTTAETSGGDVAKRRHGCDNITRAWSVASADTFDVPPIAGFVQRYLLKSKVSVDPFARNKRWATYTNDLDPSTAAASHMEAEDFLRGLVEQGVSADLVILDPPYGARQIADFYAGLGLSDDQARLVKARKPTTQIAWSKVKNLAARLQRPGDVALTFGWNSGGFGMKRGYRLIEILLVCHGGGRNDTICVAEEKLPSEGGLF